jgi:hypothetical protein
MNSKTNTKWHTWVSRLHHVNRLSGLNDLDERGNINELYVSCLAKPAANVLSDNIFGLRKSYSIIFRISFTHSALSGLWAECDAIPSHSNTTQNADTPSGAATSRCNLTSINLTPTVPYISLQCYFPPFIFVGRHRSHTTVDNIYVLKDQFLTISKFR